MAVLAKHIPSPFQCLLSAKLSPPFSYLSLFKLSVFSTSIAPAAASENPHIQQQHNPFAQFLRNECGLSESEVSKVVRARASFFKSRSRSAQTAQQAIQFFRESGFTEEQVRKIVVGNTSVLDLKVEGQLKPKLERMKALGLSGQGLANVVRTGLLTCSLEKNMIPRIEYLQTLFGSKVDLVKVLKKRSRLQTCNIERTVKPSVELLQQSGVQGELLQFLISRCPAILTGSPDSLKFKIEYVRKMGILQSSKSFVYALKVLSNNGPETLNKKLKHLASCGLLEHEIKELIRKCPGVLNTSVDKIQKIMEFLILAGFPPKTVVSCPTIFNYSLETLKKKLKCLTSWGLLEHEVMELIKKCPVVLECSEDKIQKSMEFLIHIAGFPPNATVSYGSILTYSLETRIKPRHRVFKYITALQPSKRFPSFLTLLLIGEHNFLEKYVKCSPHATTLLDIYSGKAVDLDIIQSPSLQE